MTISIRKLVPPDNQTLFEMNPELNKIWEIPAQQSRAHESYKDWGIIDKKSTGEIFSIILDDSIIGIIGWFEYGDIPDVLRLRYYGIIPRQRGNHYGERAIKLLLEHLSKTAPPQYVWLAESVSIGRIVAGQVIAHFKRMGFLEFDDPNYGSNAGCGKVCSLRIRIPLR
jgi:RimJ/RimL family protein N-acetyltransferase